MTSIKDIAQACGISVATVSKALRGYSDVSSETREKVKAMADRLGYVPDSIAQTMRTNATRNLGVVFIDEAGSGLRHEYFSSLLESFKRTVEKQGYDITLISSNTEGAPWHSLLTHCQYRRCDGVLIACVDFTNPQVTELANSDIPIITIDYQFPDSPAIFSDNRHDMKTLTDYVISRGHRNIAFIHGERTQVTEERIAGFTDACAEHSIEVPPSNLLEAEFHNPEQSERATQLLLSLAQPPTCIMYPDDYSAICVSSILRQRGVRIPEQLSIVGYDGIMMSRIIYPTLTTMRQNAFDIGQLAAEKLIGEIEGTASDEQTATIVRGSLYPGETVRSL